MRRLFSYSFRAKPPRRTGHGVGIVGVASRILIAGIAIFLFRLGRSSLDEKTVSSTNAAICRTRSPSSQGRFNEVAGGEYRV
jgi:hypothetical protein